MVKVIIFDVGGVYLKGSFTNFVNKSRKILGINEKFYANKEVVFDKRFNKGETTIEECFTKYFQAPINNQQMKKIIKEWTNTWNPSSDMNKLIIKLKKNYQLAILSNSDPVNSSNYFKKGWYKYFDTIILSHEVGVLKPKKKIYEIAINKIGVKANECLFIDDQEDCLKPAKSIGMSTILFKSVSKLENDLKKYL